MNRFTKNKGDRQQQVVFVATIDPGTQSGHAIFIDQDLVELCNRINQRPSVKNFIKPFDVLSHLRERGEYTTKGWMIQRMPIYFSDGGTDWDSLLYQ